MARNSADRVVEIDPASFTFGHALNIGAAIARAPIHFAISSHAFPPDHRWIERSLSKYDRPDVVATSGAPTFPGSPEPLLGTFYQTLAIARDHPSWGLSNTGASWRADIWASFPFDETLDACEDKEWGLRVLAAGGTIAIDSALLVTDGHRRADGIRQLHRRVRRSSRRSAPLPRSHDSPPATSSINGRPTCRVTLPIVAGVVDSTTTASWSYWPSTRASGGPASTLLLRGMLPHSPHGPPTPATSTSPRARAPWTRPIVDD